MKLVPILALCALIFAAPRARGLEPPCGLSLATLPADGPEARELVIKTYGSLLDEMGGFHLSAATLRAMADSADPFTVPRQTVRDIGDLNRKLEALKGMMVGLGWTMEQFNPALITYLQERAVQHEIAEARINALTGRVKK